MLIDQKKVDNMLPQNEFQARVKIYVQENEKLMKKYGVSTKAILAVSYNKMPFFLKILLWLMGRYKILPDIQFINTK